MTDISFPWQKFYFEALVERNPDKRATKVAATEGAISERLKQERGHLSLGELEAIEDALHKLKRIL
jgi:hypothetical protein